jgi:hypothetical protein
MEISFEERLLIMSLSNIRKAKEMIRNHPVNMKLFLQLISVHKLFYRMNKSLKILFPDIHLHNLQYQIILKSYNENKKNIKKDIKIIDDDLCPISKQYKVLLIKGQVYNQLIYHKNFRPFSDFDLIVKPEDAFEVSKFLVQLGYDGGMSENNFAFNINLNALGNLSAAITILSTVV